jgi:feruloyl esterase
MRLFGVFVGGLIFCGGSSAIASPCADLDGARMAGGVVRLAQDIEAGATLRISGQKLSGLPAFCRVVATTGVERHSLATMELWLPATDAWNQKLLGTGNGAFGGAVRYDELTGGLKRNYAVMNTDMGTFPAAVIGGAGYAAGTGEPDLIADWGYRSTHEMTVLGAAVTRTYYQTKPRQTYFSGCSTGGHQALMEAQRYPDDYDAIVAGAPGHNRTHLHLAFLQTFMDAHERPGLCHVPGLAIGAPAP